MKTTNTTLFTLFLLLCAFTSHLPSATADNFILDTDGVPILNGGTYYILPVIRGRGGGIELAATEKETCPLTIAQSPIEVSKGSPLTISSPFEISHIRETLILNISFTHAPLCALTPSQWTVILKGIPEELHVKLTGYENTIDGWFKIRRVSSEFNNDYKFVFCASDDDSECADVGAFVDGEGNRRLMVTYQNDPLLVQFQKVREVESSSAA